MTTLGFLINVQGTFIYFSPISPPARPYQDLHVYFFGPKFPPARLLGTVFILWYAYLFFQIFPPAQPYLDLHGYPGPQSIGESRRLGLIGNHILSAINKLYRDMKTRSAIYVFQNNIDHVCCLEIVQIPTYSPNKLLFCSLMSITKILMFNKEK